MSQTFHPGNHTELDGRAARLHHIRIVGTGIDVWEVIATYKSVGQRWTRLQAAYHWLDETKLRAALAYYECYPQEIEDRMQRNESWTPERLRRSYPFTRRRES